MSVSVSEGNNGLNDVTHRSAQLRVEQLLTFSSRPSSFPLRSLSMMPISASASTCVANEPHLLSFKPHAVRKRKPSASCRLLAYALCCCNLPSGWSSQYVWHKPGKGPGTQSACSQGWQGQGRKSCCRQRLHTSVHVATSIQETCSPAARLSAQLCCLHVRLHIRVMPRCSGVPLVSPVTDRRCGPYPQP